MQRGVLKSWRRDKGYGFIKVDGQDKDVFVHISELRSAGKERAINCTIKGTKGAGSSATKIIIGLVVLAAIAAAAYFLTK